MARPKQQAFITRGSTVPVSDGIINSTSQTGEWVEYPVVEQQYTDPNGSVLVLYNEESSSLKQDAINIVSKSIYGGVLAISANTARAIHNGSMHIIRIK